MSVCSFAKTIKQLKNISNLLYYIKYKILLLIFLKNYLFKNFYLLII